MDGAGWILQMMPMMAAVNILCGSAASLLAVSQ
jgi:hypothetical protein